MLVSEIMTKNTKSYCENYSVFSACERLLEENHKGGLVNEVNGKLIGYFTFKELVKSVVKKQTILSDVVIREFIVIEDTVLIQNIDFEDHSLLPVVNKEKDVIGFLMKSDYLKAISKQSQNEKIRLEQIFNSAHNGILSIDVEGRITAMNPAAEKMALSTKEQALGQLLNDVVSPTGLLNVIRTGKGFTEKYTVGKKTYLTHRTPIFDGQKLLGAVGLFQEISEVEVISSELNYVKQMVNEMEMILNNSSDGICITDATGNIIRKNAQFDKLYFKHLDKRKIDFYEIINIVSLQRKKYNTFKKLENSNNSIIVLANPIINNDGAINRIIFCVKDLTKINMLKTKIQQSNFILDNMKESEKKTDFVAKSDSMKKLISNLKRIAEIDVNVLLTGEAGVGKEETAKLIVESGPRRNKPFIKINCGAISEQMMERKLFGQAEDLVADTYNIGKAGVFECSDGGTLFLNEIEAMPLQLQPAFLKFLEEQTLTRIGSYISKAVDVRIITATNANLEKLVSEGKFMEDLYYRINTISIVVPSLRNRPEDIIELIKNSIKNFSMKYNKTLVLHDEAMERLNYYDWPNNIQELETIIEILFLSNTSGVVTLEDVNNILGRKNRLAITPQKSIVVNKIMPLKKAVEELERELISQVRITEKTYRKIAKVLEVDSSTIARKIKKLDDVKRR